MNLTRAVYETKTQKTRDFFIGFFGWFIFNVVANGLLTLAPLLTVAVPFDSENYATIQSIMGVATLVCNIAVLLINIGALIYFALTRYWIALGALAAFGALLTLVICAAVVIGGVCFVILLSAGGGSP